MKRHVAQTITLARPRRLAAALMLAALVPCGLRAGLLKELYDDSLSSSPAAAAADFELKAAEQNVATQRMRYLPRISAVGREAWAYQDIQESGNAVFLQGHNDYDATRLTVEVDQPLYDPTIGPRVDASRARLRQQQYQSRASDEWQTRLVVERFLNTVRLQALLKSSERVIARLERELDAVTRSHDARVATITDLQNIKLALAGVKRERSNFYQQLNYELGALGPASGALRDATLRLTDDVNLSAVFPSTGPDGKLRAQAGVLGEEIAEIGHNATATRRRSWPVISLYGQYSIDNASGSVFGGARDLTTVEGGLMVRWDVFDRGMNRSEARELTYRRRAKEAQLAALLTEQSRADEHGRAMLERADDGVSELEDIVKQHEVLQEATARAYAAGKETYINSITAYLTYESTLRELISARHDRLMRHVAYYAEFSGWDDTLVAKVDGLFVAADQ